MLENIHIKNFKSYKNETLKLAPLTLMIGANASGKSNALEAFRFLSWLSGGQKLSVLKNTVDDSEEILRGKVQDLGFLGAGMFTLGCEISGNKWTRYNIGISIRAGELHISGEEISSDAEKSPLYKVTQSSTGLSSDIRVAYNNFARGGKNPQVTCTDQIAVMCQLSSSAIFDKGHKKAQREIPDTTELYQRLLSNTLFLDPVPSAMRGDSFPSDKLNGDCSNLSGVLSNLVNDSDNKKVIVDFIKSLPEQDISDIEFFEDRRGRFAVELVESFGKEPKKWSVELLSDGTLRVLAIAAALLSVKEGSTVVIEEVDNGIHPSRASKLLKTMQEQATKRKIRLLLSTHNPALMDALPDTALKDVVFCYRDPKDGSSRLTRLEDVDEYVSLVSRAPLGTLVSNGVVDKTVKNSESIENRKSKAMEWLEGIKGGVL